ncbi:MAG: hypothetical protein R6X17_04620 [Candidatus Competibacteraceae bacterium]
MKMRVVGAVIVLLGLVPLSEARAGGHSNDGYRGGPPSGGYRGPPIGYRGGYRGRGYRGPPIGYRGGYRGRGYRGPWGGGVYWSGGCWNCGAAEAAIIGLGIGTLLGVAIATPPPPPPVVMSPPGPVWPRSCRAVVIDGVTYYNCDGYSSR